MDCDEYTYLVGTILEHVDANEHPDMLDIPWPDFSDRTEKEVRVAIEICCAKGYLVVNRYSGDVIILKSLTEEGRSELERLRHRRHTDQLR